MKSRRRAALLPVVMAMLFILITLVAGLHYQQAASRRTMMQAEAELLFEQGRRYEVAHELQTSAAAEPSWVSVSGDIEDDHPSKIETIVASKLFTGLPDLAPQEDTESPPTVREFKVKPKTSDLALRVFGPRKWEVVSREGATYAAYAPKGKITISEVFGWSNPTFANDKVQDAGEAPSGEAALLFASGKIDLDKLRYGYAYSKGGVEIDDGLAVAFAHGAPLRDYSGQLAAACEQAKQTLEGKSISGDKTRLIAGNIFSKAGEVFSLFTGGDFDSGTFSPTLEEAMNFRMPIIPIIGQTIPGLFYEVYFFVPFVSDLASFDGADEGKGQNTAKELKALREKWEAAKKKVQDLQAKVNAESDSNKKADLQKELDDAQKELDKIEKQYKDAEQNLKDNAEANRKKIENQTGGNIKDPPATRQDDIDDIPKKSGTVGWSYSWVINSFAKIIEGMLTLDLDTAFDAIAPRVRIVHFGSDKTRDTSDLFDVKTSFSGSRELESAVTWTVPRGRTFRFDGDMTVTGDLWVQKGGVFAVTGNLTLVKPSSSTAQSLNPFFPKGRLFLEEGATLVVGKDFEAVGSNLLGSVLVGSRPGQIHPLNASILCGGKVTLRNGSFAGATLDDLARWVGDVLKAPALVQAADAITPIFVNVAPNLAKLVGPFHMRRPYPAQFATTFQITIIPVIEVPVPTPIPLPHKNMYVTIFRALTYLYTPVLNWNLGENLYTHCDWWFFGEGVVPMVPKIDPIKAGQGLTGLSLSGITVDFDWKEELKTFATDVLTDLAVFVVKKVIQKVITKILTAAAIPGGSFIGDALDTIIDLAGFDSGIDSIDDLAKKFINQAMDKVKDVLNQVLDQLKQRIIDSVDDGILREVPGVFIYAEDISIGYDSNGSTTSVTPLVASGMFVAKNSFRANCRNVVGTVTVLNGDIEINGRLLYVPYFGRASLHLPADSPSDFIGRGADFLYGEARDQQKGSTAIDVTSGFTKVVSEGWSR